jgi:hypothetical protein
MERERRRESEIILYIILSVLFLLGPLSGIYNPGKTMNMSERRYHDDPHGFFTFFVLLPDKNSTGEIFKKNNTAVDDKLLSLDTTKSLPVLSKQKNPRP